MISHSPSSRDDQLTLALFCDFENLALGAREQHLGEFDVAAILERLLLKGNIVVKKAYCDWQRYTSFRRAMHEAAFELIEVPHTTQAGKNSADIRMVVDALDLCYTKAHVNTFVIISGDSDFSPLVSKLRENDKTVIGVGIRANTSGLLKDNCDDFVFYDDLIKAKRAKAAKHAEAKVAQKAAPKKASTQPKSAGSTPSAPPVAIEPSEAERQAEALELVVDTIDGLLTDSNRTELAPSQIKGALKRLHPNFTESAYGFKGGFNRILEEGERRKLVRLRKEGTNYMVSLPD
jgi:uncharacterized protein (TIGR00288 family)